MKSQGGILRLTTLITTLLAASTGGWTQTYDESAQGYSDNSAVVDDDDAPELAPERGAVFARLMYFEGGLSLKREENGDQQNAALAVNSPLVPGDQLWTGEDGRAEIQLADGSLLRLDRNSRLWMLNLSDKDATFDNTTLLRLLDGSLYVRAGAFDARQRRFQIDTPSGSIFLLSGGVYRVDIGPNGVATVSSFRGVAESMNDDLSVMAHSGERVTTEPDHKPGEARAFNTLRRDPFDVWSESRDEETNALDSARGQKPEVPPSVSPYVGELDRYGDWRYDATYGWVWLPERVDEGWRPYYYGQWTYTPVGMTWVSYEPWGWAPYHYGRWHWAASFGWFWIPGFTYSGAYVSWSVGPSYFGWAPLGFYDYPVYYRTYYPWVYVPYGCIYNTHVNHYAYGWADISRRHMDQNAVIVHGQPYARPGYRPEQWGATTYRRALASPRVTRPNAPDPGAPKVSFKNNDLASYRRALGRQGAPEIGSSAGGVNPRPGRSLPGRTFSGAPRATTPVAYRPGASTPPGSKASVTPWRPSGQGNLSPVTGRPMQRPVTINPDDPKTKAPAGGRDRGGPNVTPSDDRGVSEVGPVRPRGSSSANPRSAQLPPGARSGNQAPPSRDAVVSSPHPRVYPGRGGNSRSAVTPNRPATPPPQQGPRVSPGGGRPSMPPRGARPSSPPRPQQQAQKQKDGGNKHGGKH